MTNDSSEAPSGYRLGREARVVLHRHGARRAYAVAVVLDEGPFTLRQASDVANAVREKLGGWVTKAEAAERLGVTERQVDYLRESGHLAYSHDETKHVLIDVKSLEAEIDRRCGE